MSGDARLRIRGFLDYKATLDTVNVQIAALEKKINKLKLQVQIDDRTSKTLSDFSRAMEHHKKISGDLTNIRKEETLVTQRLDGSVDRVTKQYLKSGEIIEKNTKRIREQGKAAVDSSNALQKQGNALKSSQSHQLSIMDAFRTAMIKFPLWMAASTIFFGSFRSLEYAINVITEVDTRLTNLKKVMSEDTNFTRIMDNASASAAKFGKTISEVLDAYTEFARQGYQEQDLINLGDAGLITSNVGEISSAQAAEYLTAAMVQFKLETKDSMQVIDAWNNIANRNATTVEKLAQGMAKAGATANAFGLDMDELNAIVGTVNYLPPNSVMS